MSDIRIIRYNPDMKGMWDDFVKKSRNATILLLRDYMDYHSDRFEDHSVMVYKGNRLSALLPANISEESGVKILHSHGGLTYGGLILPESHFDAVDILEFFNVLKLYASTNGISGLDYKPIPKIYASMPSDEDRYALFRNNAMLTECNISSTVCLQHNPGFNTLQKRNLKKAVKAGYVFRETRDINQFHGLLSECLSDRHGVSPVHSLEELELLHNRFPENIMIFEVSGSEEIKAGVCVYLCRRVVHAQYICSSAEGRENGALAFLFAMLIDKFRESYDYFDFGISNEDHGYYLNEGLYRQKTALGGRGSVYERYYLDLKP